jgi:pimeloyl-ACP methyl ester carboxylesterase
VSAGQRLPGAPEPERYFAGAGVQLAADTFGRPGDPLVVFNHGAGQTRHSWRGSAELLASQGYFCVALDARGHGDSEWAADGNYERSIMVEDLAVVLEQLDAGPAALVGASMGGNTSLAAVGEGLVTASALVLVDIAPRIRQAGGAKVGQFMEQNPDGFESLDEVADAIANYQPHRKRKRNLDGLAKNIRLGVDGKYHWHWDPAYRRWAPRTRDEIQIRTRRLEDAARGLTMPTLLVRGGLSDVLDEAGAQAFLDLVPHAEYVNITGAAHMVAGDRNDTFGTAVIDFLARAVPIMPG